MFGMIGIHAFIEKDFLVIFEKAPYVAAMVVVVWIHNRQQEKTSKNFTDTLNQFQKLIREVSVECHEVQGDSVQTSKDTIVRMGKLEAKVETHLNLK